MNSCRFSFGVSAGRGPCNEVRLAERPLLEAFVSVSGTVWLNWRNGPWSNWLLVSPGVSVGRGPCNKVSGAVRPNWRNRTFLKLLLALAGHASCQICCRFPPGVWGGSSIVPMTMSMSHLTTTLVSHDPSFFRSFFREIGSIFHLSSPLLEAQKTMSIQ